MVKRRKRLRLEDYIDGVLNSKRGVLSRAITLIESNHPEDKELASQLSDALQSRRTPDKAFRIGVTGVPGVGKSTFIESFGLYLCDLGYKIAVLTIDPSSQRTGGSILGDKTRMDELSQHPNAYIRPSASGSSLGGVAAKTRESMLLCEAAGFDIVLVETVGVGQSETAVKGMVDFFLLLMLAGAGDELQGIKKGIMEMADAIAINKSDGNNETAAKKAKGELTQALHLFPRSESGWQPQVFTISAVEKKGISDLWANLNQYQVFAKSNLFWTANRQRQNVKWLHDVLQYELLDELKRDEMIKEKLKELELGVKEGRRSVPKAVKILLKMIKKT
ncbi:MAG: methylmalonyl Co-A mutase-associated GTPase MeaB [Cyclobacteriaceae bacterium]|nr:methylmalonyl Co-A mutase-associated GTPase MeaB [Cyclobacteriaceae bacterium]MCH8515555.1 methylmalonyl Co-A mutase-associated GTPase MeaB [Cyclobacteriaceae bacterium]